MIDFKFTEEQEMWRKELDEIVEREAGREYTRMCDLERRFPKEFLDVGVKQGWLGLMIPAKYGGLECDAILFTIFCECTSKYSYEMGALFTTPMYVAMNVVDFGTEEQKERYLPAFAKGEIRFSVSITEPNAGSDAASLSTNAVLNGDHFVVNGSKVFSSMAHLPNNIILLACRTDKNVPKHEGISVLLVPNDLPGIEWRLLNLIVARATGTTEISFSDVPVPRENLLGGLNKGWDILIKHLNLERVAVAAGNVAQSQTALTHAMNYAKQRVQFGRPISKFQAIRHMLADLQTEVDAGRLLTYRAASMHAEGVPWRKEASMAKLFTQEVFYRVTTAGMQVGGGYSMMPEFDMERHWRHAKVQTIGGGSSQILRSVIAREMEL